MTRFRTPATYFFARYWSAYHRALPEYYGGRSKDTESSLAELWHYHSRFLPRAWRSLQASILPPDTWLKLENFTTLYSIRRESLLEPGGPLITKQKLPRKRQQRSVTIDDRRLDQHIKASERELYHALHPHLHLSLLRRCLFHAKVLKPTDAQSALTSHQVATLALSGAIRQPQVENPKSHYHLRHPLLARRRRPSFFHRFTSAALFLWLSSFLTDAALSLGLTRRSISSAQTRPSPE
jgi:hypothetical protein